MSSENKLASLKATLVETTVHSLTGVKYRANSVAKSAFQIQFNYWPIETW